MLKLATPARDSRPTFGGRRSRFHRVHHTALTCRCGSVGGEKPRLSFGRYTSATFTKAETVAIGRAR
jgi:hypothetical protein